MNDLESLYKQVIMEHYKYPHNKGLLDNEKYMNGEIFTTYEQIKKFVREKL